MNEATVSKPESEKPLIEIELATPGDAETICRIRDEAWIDAYPSEELGLTAEDIRINAQGLNGEFVPRRVKWFKKKIAETNDDWIAYVGKMEGVVRGFVVASKDDSGRMFLNSLYVEPDSQGKGLGGKLMQTAMDWLGDDEDIYLEVASHNDKAIHFYEKFGFEKTDSIVPGDPDRPSYIKPIPQTEMVLRAR